MKRSQPSFSGAEVRLGDEEMNALAGSVAIEIDDEISFHYRPSKKDKADVGTTPKPKFFKSNSLDLEFTSSMAMFFPKLQQLRYPTVRINPMETPRVRRNYHGVSNHRAELLPSHQEQSLIASEAEGIRNISPYQSAVQEQAQTRHYDPTPRSSCSSSGADASPSFGLAVSFDGELTDLVSDICNHPMTEEGSDAMNTQGQPLFHHSMSSMEDDEYDALFNDTFNI
jgi:hypothetical protein